MIQLGLIGYPLGHSLSPKIHEAALKACSLDGSYSLFPIQPDDKQGLADLLASVRSGETTGLNITIPHKQNVIEFLDELTPTAKAIGAVNTIYLRENKLVGDNTDAPGFLSDLKKFVGEQTMEEGRSALVLGAGGSARAVVYALLQDGWNVTLLARRPEQAQQFINSFADFTLHVINTVSNITFSNFALIVNATPVGMTPNVDESPLPENASLSFDTIIYDLVYNPRETRLVRDACAQGLNATTGLGMLIEQAALAFELWTGLQPSRKVLWNAVESDL